MADKDKERRRNAGRRGKPDNSRKIFLAIIGAVIVIGALSLAYMTTRKTDPTTVQSISAAPPGGAKAEGYVLGNPAAPVHILEFADFECPSCARFSILSEADVRKRIIDAGLASFTFFDFPLPMHKNSLSAHNAAACAAEQGKFWEMHDRIFNEQDRWNTEATDDPTSLMHDYAQAVGVTSMDQWDNCYKSRKYQYKIDANQAEGTRRNVNSTPSFIIGDKLFAGALSYDEFKKYVDEAVAAQGKVPTGQ
jgi:protein-disulfide isomerase